MSDTADSLSPARGPRPATRGSRVVRLALIVIAAAVLVDALVGEKGLLATIRARHEYTELSAQISRTRTENANLREVARGLREDPNAIEELARRELGLIRPGETLFIIKDVAPAK